ncbi:MAG: alpha/beta hydrolase [Trueperaceae bacterium]
MTHPADAPARPSRTVRWLLGTVAALALVVLIVLTAIPIVVTRDIANRHVAFSQTWTGDAYGLEPERVRLTTSDGLELAAHAVHHPAPRAVVIFLSGTHNPSVTAFFGHAAWLQGHGYASLLVELRAHGESDGERIGLGFEEVLDVQAAVDHLGRQPAYTDVPIVAYGLSLGGATAINATGLTPEIDALVSLSAFSSWSDVFVASMGLPEPFASVQRPFVGLYTSIAYGFDRRSVVPKTQIRNLGERPALLIHSRGDTQVAFENFERLVAAAPPHVETWAREGDEHLIVAEGSFLNPQDDAAYAARVLDFLERSIGR